MCHVFRLVLIRGFFAKINIMKLENVRITNFRCIDNSNPFHIGQVTCLVGKNESGKTSVRHHVRKAILRAQNHKGKSPEPGGGCNVERSRVRRARH
jgi:hypothetical protein